MAIYESKNIIVTTRNEFMSKSSIYTPPKNKWLTIVYKESAKYNFFIRNVLRKKDQGFLVKTQIDFLEEAILQKKLLKEIVALIDFNC